MSEHPTIITLTLPPSDRLDAQGTLLIQRGTLAHLTQFTYIGVQDIAATIQSAYAALAAVEGNPPIISESASASPEPVSKVAKASSAEPMLEIPVGKKTQRIRARLLQVTQPEQQSQAIQIASKLLSSKLWDGQSVIRISNATLILKKLQPLDDKTLSLFTLADFVESGEIESCVSNTENADPLSGDFHPHDSETPSTFHVGQRVHLMAGATDRDGDVVPFNVGRIVELDASEDPVQVWVESTDGNNDVWVSAAFLQPLTADL